MGTLIFGFSTTVLAVIVIMLVLQRSKEPPGKEASAAPHAAVAEPVSNAASGPNVTAVAAALPAATVSPSSSNEADASVALKPGTKTDHQKKNAKDPTKKSSAPDDGPAAGDSKGQPPSKHYVPNEL